jgi:hypothetical protein
MAIFNSYVTLPEGRPLSRFFRLFDGEFTFQLTRHPFLAGADLSQLTAGFW